MSQHPVFSIVLEPTGSRAMALTATLRFVVDGETVWPVRGKDEYGIEIPLDDLFAKITRQWNRLLLDQTYPLGLLPDLPSQIESKVHDRWQRIPQEQVDEEASELDAFEEAHNLVTAFGGLFDLPPFWLMRQGDEFIYDAGSRIFGKIPFKAVREELVRVGDKIAEQMASEPSGTWTRAINAWKNRDQTEAVQLVAISGGFQKSVASKLLEDELIKAPASFDDIANDNDELLIAARMAGSLPTDQIVKIIELARRFDYQACEKLDKMSVAAIEHLEAMSAARPFEEGLALAQFTRDWFDIDSKDRFDIDHAVHNLGVEIITEAVGLRDFDGLAIAGTRYGPGAFINLDSKRLKHTGKGEWGAADLPNDAGYRINLAHELCHLIVDREHPFTAVEVLNSRMPTSIEQRARAFAGELLLPSEMAASVWEEVGSPIEIEPLAAVMQRLADDFGVSFSVIRWKIWHHAQPVMSGERDNLLKLRAALEELTLPS